MDGSRISRDRVRRRCYECSRVEEELWKLAYERLFPPVRRGIKPEQSAHPTAAKVVVAVRKGA